MNYCYSHYLDSDYLSNTGYSTSSEDCTTGLI